MLVEYLGWPFIFWMNVPVGLSASCLPGAYCPTAGRPMIIGSTG
jgi:hypothetical protein